MPKLAPNTSTIIHNLHKVYDAYIYILYKPNVHTVPSLLRRGLCLPHHPGPVRRQRVCVVHQPILVHVARGLRLRMQRPGQEQQKPRRATDCCRAGAGGSVLGRRGLRGGMCIMYRTGIYYSDSVQKQNRKKKTVYDSCCLLLVLLRIRKSVSSGTLHESCLLNSCRT